MILNEMLKDDFDSMVREEHVARLKRIFGEDRSKVTMEDALDEIERLKTILDDHGPEGHNVTNEQYVAALQDIDALRDVLVASTKEIMQLRAEVEQQHKLCYEQYIDAWHLRRALENIESLTTDVPTGAWGMHDRLKEIRDLARKTLKL
jgi:hypothetical protein